MQITLLRHGKPAFEWNRKAKGSELDRIIEEYDTSGIEGRPPQQTLDLASSHYFIVSSDLPRSTQSAKAIGVENIDLKSKQFIEVGMPYFSRLPVVLPLCLWVIFYRVLWLVGFSKNAESLRMAKARAKQANRTLIELAETHQKVLVVGHGLFNHLLAKELRKSGWQGPRSPGKKHWEFGSYTK